MDEAAEPSWEEISPVVDEAVATIPEKLRLPVILRFLQSRSQAEVAEELKVSRSTVLRRTERGVELLQDSLRRAGVAVPAARLAALLSDKAFVAAPAALVASLGKIALVGKVGQGAGAGASTGGDEGASATGGTARGPSAGIWLLAVVALSIVCVVPNDWSPSEPIDRELRRPPVRIASAPSG